VADVVGVVNRVGEVVIEFAGEIDVDTSEDDGEATAVFCGFPPDDDS
jgi:hypothetical protein